MIKALRLLVAGNDEALRVMYSVVEVLFEETMRPRATQYVPAMSVGHIRYSRKLYRKGSWGQSISNQHTTIIVAVSRSSTIGISS